jgi:hypothetical protein
MGLSHLRENAVDTTMQKIDAQLGDAHAVWDGEQLRLTSGSLERVWQVVPHGLQTIRLGDRRSGVAWIDEAVGSGASRSDWLVRWIADGSVTAQLLSASVRAVTDASFTSEHVSVELVFRYPYLDSHFDLRWRAWAYPGTCGVRTQIGLKPGRTFAEGEVPGFLSGSLAERLSIDTAGTRRCAAGYYNDTQHRNFDHTPLLKEETRSNPIDRREIYDWANLLCIERGDGAGLAFVKESHKCVNQEGFDSGAFILSPREVAISGLGYDEVGNSYLPSRKFNDPDDFVDAWATWLVSYADGDGATAIKRFDRARFAPTAERDLFLKANTWGSRGPIDAPAAATEENMLREITSCADLGVEAIEIDDGWQRDPEAPPHNPPAWRPYPGRFPHGWERVRGAAAEQGVSLLLWAPGSVPETDLLWNLEAGDFRGCKLDFLNFRVREELDAFMKKAAGICQHRGPRFHVNTDVTENAARVGYFLAREFGPIFLENRELPLTWHKLIAYKPHLVLRDAWHLALYVNLNQVLVSFVDKDRVPADLSDAHLYSHAYNFAIVMMGLPLLFMETQLLSPDARAELRPLIELYKAHRHGIYRGIVSPIGDEPDGASWSGFVSHDPASSGGYVTLFRERRNSESQRSLALPPLADSGGYLWQDLLSGSPANVRQEQAGHWTFQFPQPASFGFYRYAAMAG